MNCPHCKKPIPLTVKEISIKGGKSTSVAKQRASRLNGIKGGYPKGRHRKPASSSVTEKQGNPSDRAK